MTIPAISSITSAISGLGGVDPTGGLSSAAGAGAVSAGQTAGTTATTGSDGFAKVLSSSIDQLQSTQATADALGQQALTGDLKDPHTFMIASTEAALSTEMVVNVRNKCVDAFNEIMRMPV